MIKAVVVGKRVERVARGRELRTEKRLCHSKEQGQFGMGMTHQTDRRAAVRWPHTHWRWRRTAALPQCPPTRVHRRSLGGSATDSIRVVWGLIGGSLASLAPTGGQLRLMPGPTSMHSKVGALQTLTTDMFCGRFSQTTAILEWLTQLALLK